MVSSPTLKIVNNSSMSIVNTYLKEHNKKDWSNERRPSKVLSGRSIPSKATLVEQLEEVKSEAAKGIMSLTLMFEDGSKDIFKFDNKMWKSTSNLNFQHRKKSHSLEILKENDPSTLSLLVTDADDEKADELSKEAEKLYDENQLISAQTKFIEAHRYAKNPKAIAYLNEKIVNCYNKLGINYAQTGNFSSAERCFVAAKKYGQKDVASMMSMLKLIESKEDEKNRQELSGLLLYQVNLLLHESYIKQVDGQFGAALEKQEIAKQKLEEALEFEINTNEIHKQLKVVENNIKKLRSVLNLTV